MSLRSFTIKKRAQNSTSSLRKIQPIRLTDPFLERSLAEDEAYLHVIAIREEIIDNALNLCNESYNKTQSVKFLVSCLHEAYLKMFSTIYMHYDMAVLDVKNMMWSPDVQFQPLPLDNYSEFSVPFSTSAREAREVGMIEVDICEKEGVPVQAPVVSSIDVIEAEEDGLATIPDEAKSTEERLTTEGYANEDVTFFMQESFMMEGETAVKALSDSTTEFFEEVTSETSFFTGVAEANILPPIAELRCKHPYAKTSDTRGNRSMAVLGDIAKNKLVLPSLRLKAKFRASELSYLNVKSNIDNRTKNSSLLKSEMSDIKDDETVDKVDISDESPGAKKKVDIQNEKFEDFEDYADAADI